MRYILSELDEQEREESFRLKRFKQLKYKNVKPKSTDTENSEEEPICCLLKEEEPEPTKLSPRKPMIQPESEKIIPPVDTYSSATKVPPPPKVEPIIPPTTKVDPCCIATKVPPPSKVEPIIPPTPKVDPCSIATKVPPPSEVEPIIPPPPKVDPCICATKIPPPPKVEPIIPPPPKVEPIIPPSPKVDPCSCFTKMPPPKEEKASSTATQERLDHLMKHVNEILQIAKELQGSKQTPRIESFIKCCDEVKGKIKDLSFAPSPRGDPKVCSETPIMVSREPSVSSKQPSICSKPSEKPSICSKPSEKPSICSKPSEKPSICSKPSEKPSICSKPSEKPSICSKPSEKPLICSKPSEKPSICSKPSEKPSICSKPSVTLSAPLKVQSDVFELEPVNKTTLGEFEKRFEEKIKVTRTRNPDGSLNEKKQIITIQTETRKPRLEKDGGGAKSPCSSGGHGKRGDGSDGGKKRGETRSPSCTSKISGFQTPSRTSKFSGSRTPSCTSKTSESRSPTSTCTCNVSRVTNEVFSSGMSRVTSETCWTQVASKPIGTFKPCGTPKQCETSKRCNICGASTPSKTAKPCGTPELYDTSKPCGTPKPSDTSKPCGAPKLSETPKPCAASKSSVTSELSRALKPSDMPCGATKASESFKPCGCPAPSVTTTPSGTLKPDVALKPGGASKSSETSMPCGTPMPSETLKPCGCPAPRMTTTPSGTPKPNVTLKPCGCSATVPSKASATSQSSDTCTCGLSCFSTTGSYVTPTSYPLPRNEQSSCVGSPKRLMMNTCSSKSTASSLLGSTTCSCILVSGSENQSKELPDPTKTKLTFKSESTSSQSFFQNLPENPLKKPEEKPAENHSGDKSAYCIPNCGAIRIGKNASNQSKCLFAIASPPPGTTSNSLQHAKAGQSDSTRTSSNAKETSNDSVIVVRGSRLNALRKMILPSVNSMDCHIGGIASVSNLSSYTCLCASSQTSASSIKICQAQFQLNPECLTCLATKESEVEADMSYTPGMHSCGSQSVSFKITPEPASCAVLAECKAAVAALAEHIRNAGSFSPSSSNIWYPIFGTPTCFKDAMTSPALQDRKDSNPFEALYNDQDRERVIQRLSSSSTDTHLGNEQDKCDLIRKVSSSSI